MTEQAFPERSVPPGDTQSLGESLGPALRQACAGRLGEIAWFRSSRQHSGAATGYATFTLPDGSTTEVVVKLPIGPVEHRWTTLLGAAGSWHDAAAKRLPIPRVAASGVQLAGYDLAWIILERLGGNTLASELSEATVLDLLRTLDDFHSAAGSLAEVTGRPREENWPELLARALAVAAQDALPECHRWKEAIKKVGKHVAPLAARWNSRPINAWCHGDFHPGNALRRVGSEDDESARRGCVLIDLAFVHPGHWVEDALYLERLFWARPELLHGVKPLSTLARLRRERNAANDTGYAEIACVRRVLMAATAPAYLSTEGHPKHLHAALEVLERNLPQALK